MGKIIALANQKGGVGKTTTAVSLGVGLAMKGKKVLLVDFDPQGSMTISMGHQVPDNIETTISDILKKIIVEEDLPKDYAIIHERENLDLIPANLDLSSMEVSLVNIMSRELVLKTYIEQIKDDYDYILIDCTPSLGLLTINALACSDSVIIPVQSEYLSVKGLQALIKTIYTVKRRLNTRLVIDGILFTMYVSSTNNAKGISEAIKESYGNDLKIYPFEIPASVKAKEAPNTGRSIFDHAPKSKVAEAYTLLIKEVLKHG